MLWRIIISVLCLSLVSCTTLSIPRNSFTSGTKCVSVRTRIFIERLYDNYGQKLDAVEISEAFASLKEAEAIYGDLNLRFAVVDIEYLPMNRKMEYGRYQRQIGPCYPDSMCIFYIFHKNLSSIDLNGIATFPYQSFQVPPEDGICLYYPTDKLTLSHEIGHELLSLSHHFLKHDPRLPNIMNYSNAAIQFIDQEQVRIGQKALETYRYRWIINPSF